MRLLNLEFKNIGPFIKGNINFISEEDNTQNPPVTIITGEDGTGKTIILDAIRGLLFGNVYSLERNIIRDTNDFSVSLEFVTDTKKEIISSFYLKSDLHFKPGTNVRDEKRTHTPDKLEKT
ncbi:MAG: hypothetical protein DRI57_22275 [Deltaproteobacteria bacterium]|nr:MAG: hypothetical protein DRI57_22275 [Deltaproteobacteria bacterium]